MVVFRLLLSEHIMVKYFAPQAMGVTVQQMGPALVSLHQGLEGDLPRGVFVAETAAFVGGRRRLSLLTRIRSGKTRKPTKLAPWRVSNSWLLTGCIVSRRVARKSSMASLAAASACRSLEKAACQLDRVLANHYWLVLSPHPLARTRREPFNSP
jgi:hypothetical protein